MLNGDSNNNLFMLLAIAVLVYLIFSYNKPCNQPTESFTQPINVAENFDQPTNVTGIYPLTNPNIQPVQPVQQQAYIPSGQPSVNQQMRVDQNDPTLLAQQQLLNQQMQDQILQQQRLQQFYNNQVPPGQIQLPPPITQQQPVVPKTVFPVQSPTQVQVPYRPTETLDNVKQNSVNVPIINQQSFNPNDKVTFESLAPAEVTNFLIDIDSRDPKFSTQVQPQKERLTSNELLPKNLAVSNGKQWFDTPSVGIKVEDANLLGDAIDKVGIDTIGQTLKNASWDLRGSIPCPKFVVSPWSNSTIEPDINLKSLY